MLISTAIKIKGLLINNANAIGCYDYAFAILFASSVILGSVILYRINKAGDDKEFIERYIDLSILILIQCVLLYLLEVALLAIFTLVTRQSLGQAFNVSPEDNSGFMKLVLTAPLDLYFYCKMAHSMKMASGVKAY